MGGAANCFSLALQQSIEKIIIMSKIKPVFVMAAAVSIQFVLGVALTYGNIVPYIVSYVRLKSQPAYLRYTDSTYVFACQLCGRGLFTFLGSVLESHFGPRIVTFCGGLVLCTGTFISYFAICEGKRRNIYKLLFYFVFLRPDFYILLLTYFMIGAAIGISYFGPVSCVMKWYPQRKALVTGIVSSGFMLGGAVIPLIQTLYINPENLPASDNPYPDSPNERYYIENQLLERVPRIYLIMGGIFTVLMLIGSLFIVNPPPQSVSVVDFGADSISTTTKNNDLTKTDGQDNTPVLKRLNSKDILRLPSFYILWLIFFVTMTDLAFITSLYKVYGFEEIVNNDLFMTFILVATSIIGIAGRIMWGLIADRISYKFSLVLELALISCTVSTLYSTSSVNEAMYFIWMCLLYLGFSGHFTIFPMTVAETFGQENFGVSYGMIFTGQIFSGLFAGLLSGFVIHWIGWWGTFFVLTGMNILAFVLAIVFVGEKKER